MKYLTLFSVLIYISGCQTLSQTHTPNDPVSIKPQTPELDQALLAIAMPGLLTYKPAVTNSIAPRKLVDKTNLWHRLQDGMSLKYAKPPQSDVKHISELASFQTRNPKLANKIFDKAEPYLHHIVDAIEQRGLPGELAMIPLVESKFNPQAYSHSNAAGLWQFIPMTAKRFKLTNNWWIDERRDVVASTEAALDYLEYLNKFFDGDWLLAIAAYNGGEGRVQRAIRKNKKLGRATDFWSLDLPAETREYIPKILSWAKVIKQPTSYKITLQKIPNEPHFTAIDMGSQVDLKRVAKMIGVPLEQLTQLNPAYKRQTIDPTPPHRILVPADKAFLVKKALVSLPTTERANWKRYKIKVGDSLSIIARKFGTTIKALKVANNLSSTIIRVGKTLVIPTIAEEAKEYAQN